MSAIARPPGPSRTRRRWPLATAVAVLSAAAIGLGVDPQTRARFAPVSAGTGTIYVGTYKGVIAVIDEATEKVTSEIPVGVGIPIGLTLSDDRSKIYVRDATYEKVEWFDRLSGRSLGSFTLTEGKAKVRIWSLRPDPKDQYLILTIKRYTLKDDRWEIGPPTLVQYSLAERRIIRTIPWPRGEEREGVGVLFSPDGTLLYMFGQDILVYETETFTEVDRWDVSRPIEPGAGSVPIGGLAPILEEPGFYTGFVTMQDPVQGRRIMGIGRLDLAGRKITFHPIGPSRGLAFTMTPDRKRGYGLMQSIEEYELWAFDLESYRVISRTRFNGRPRMGLRASSNGQVLYIHTAGNTIDLYEAATFTPLRTITLDGDMTSFLLVPPAPGAPAR